MLESLPGWITRAVFGVAEASPFVAKRVNRFLINRIMGQVRTRPHPLSTVHDYVSWRGLTEQAWSARHLPADPERPRKDPTVLKQMFARPAGPPRLCPKSTCLFPSFAQYLTDGFIRTETDGLAPPGRDPADRLRRNTSNHQIDLCPLYGRTLAQTDALRLKDESKGRRGRLKSQMIGAEEYAPFLYSNGRIAPEFEVLDPPLGLREKGGPDDPDAPDPKRRDALFAVGGDRVNSVPQTAMMNTLFLREHNRLAGEIEAEHPDWDDERVFQTARNSVIALFIKMVVEDYINHIAPIPFRLRADPSVAWRAPWNKPNWITTEFSLLYRWHGLIPDEMRWGSGAMPTRKTFMNNRPLIEGGLMQGFVDMSAQRAHELGAFNTPASLLFVEEASIRQDHACALASYADYCRYVGRDRPARFKDISSKPEVQRFLAENYTSPRDVDFFVGLFAEDRVPNSPLPRLILTMVAIDAFSQALTNPLLSEHVFRKETFSGPGWRAIRRTTSLSEIVERNCKTPLDGRFIGMTRPGWQPED